MKGTHRVSYIHSLSLKNNFHDQKDLRLFNFHVTSCLNSAEYQSESLQNKGFAQALLQKFHVGNKDLLKMNCFSWEGPHIPKNTYFYKSVCNSIFGALA